MKSTSYPTKVHVTLSFLVPRDAPSYTVYMEATISKDTVCVFSNGCMIEAWITAVTSECVMDRSPEPHPHLHV